MSAIVTQSPGESDAKRGDAARPAPRVRFPMQIATREMAAGWKLAAVMAPIPAGALLVSQWGEFHLLFSAQADQIMETGAFVSIAGFGALLLALMLGAMCGAEEEENGTADFVRRLPVGRWRVLGAKLVGSAALLMGYGLVAVAIFIALSAILGVGLGRQVPELWSEIRREPDLISGAAAMLVLHSMGLIAGVAIKRVIPAIFAAIGLYVLLGGLIALIVGQSLGIDLDDHPGVALLTIALALYLLAGWIFARREGR